jgi:hypothetical protein
VRLWFVAILFGACKVDHPCDPGFHEVHGACFKDVVPCVECTDDPYSGFGCPCVLQDAGPDAGPDAGVDAGPGCNCVADFCAVNPGAAQGFCTIEAPSGCLTDPTICPATNWQCFDTEPVGGAGDMCICSDISLDTYTCPNPIR